MRAWAWPNNYDLFLMGVCGVIAAVAMSLLTNAYRTADANLVTVFEYTGMFWAPLWGFLIPACSGRRSGVFCFLGKYRAGPLLRVLA